VQQRQQKCCKQLGYIVDGSPLAGSATPRVNAYSLLRQEFFHRLSFYLDKNYFINAASSYTDVFHQSIF